MLLESLKGSARMNVLWQWIAIFLHPLSNDTTLLGKHCFMPQTLILLPELQKLGKSQNSGKLDSKIDRDETGFEMKS